ncbi:thiamine phosphate synthase [Vibrio sp. SM6]|uniref:Thiamine phosphate synthase n=1 Tax=Vibrio agarilyticus TaxID=2726741 RepID=A0A7X8YIJ4_9VIBR|nr:thiamine phosphate synthase [Vibrio agarilyticus]NLS14799.1 thiamine phosphate synthase [Vibrio agarilyticus]
MNKLLIPPSLENLIGLIEQCLLLAKEQGFAVDEIELGVSPTQSVHIATDSHTVQLDTDLAGEISQSSAGTNAVRLFYRSDLSVPNCLHQSSRSVFIGVEDALAEGETQCLDIWRHPINNEVRALSISQKAKQSFRKEHHFAWTLVLLTLEFPLEDALTLSRAMASKQNDVSRETSKCDEGKIAGQWACEFKDFPIPVLEHSGLGIQVGWSPQGHSVSFPTMTKESLGLYPVVDDVTWIETLLALGINTIQLRIKDPQQADLELQIERAIALGRQYNAQVFINDYWQLAIEHGAFGVHLGQEDIEASNLAQLSAAGIKLGLSTHGYYELLRIIQINPSYIALGHIFPTTTKEMPSKPQGLVRLALYQKLIDSIPYGQSESFESNNPTRFGFPTVAIGGIDQSNAEQVWQTGVSCLAVVRAITLAQCPATVIGYFNQLMQQDIGKSNRSQSASTFGESGVQHAF